MRGDTEIAFSLLGQVLVWLMATICLITPPSVFLLDERVFITLGILRVASCLEAAGHTVEHLDLSGIENFEEAAKDHASISNASCFGLTATTPQMPAATKIAKALRLSRPDARLILGGPHITLVNAALKREKKLGISEGRAARAFNKLEGCFDVLVAGDGEDAIHIAISKDTTKLVDADDPKSMMFLTNDRLNELPWPARHLVDVDSYHYSIDNERALSLIAQLGCPFNCGFCGGRESPMLRRIRMRSTPNVVAEMEHIYTHYSAKGLMLYDDELNVNQQMIELMDAIAAKQRELEAQFRLRGFIKSQLFTEEQAAAMHRAGFRWILVGFESGSPRILENINKKATRDENTRCLQIARRAGLKVKALMSIGHPGESTETVAETRQWLMDQKPDDFDVTIITTYPGTPYFDHAVRRSNLENIWTYTWPKTGDQLHAKEIDFSEQAGYYKGIPGEYESYVFTDHLTPEDLVRLRDDLESEVREKLCIPFNSSAAAQRYEHSMGQCGKLPDNILRSTACLTSAS